MIETHFKRSKLSTMISFENYTTLNNWYLETKSKNTKVPVSKALANSKGANLLTRLVMLIIQMKGGFAQRVNTMGIFRDGKWTHSGGTPGSADVHAIINGVSWHIEIKYGRDKISEAQLKYGEKIRAAGGNYLVLRNANEIFDI